MVIRQGSERCYAKLQPARSDGSKSHYVERVCNGLVRDAHDDFGPDDDSIGSEYKDTYEEGPYGMHELEETDLEAGLIVEGKRYVYLGYAARWWVEHFNYAGNSIQPTLIASVAQVTCCPLEHSSTIWRSLYHSQVDFEIPQECSTPIIAAWLHLPVVMKVLLADNKTDVNHQDSRGRTALWYAITGSCKEMSQLLLELENIRVNLPDNEGRSPLFYALRFSDTTILKSILNRKDIDADMRDAYGNTPLGLAVVGGEIDAMVCLLEREDVDMDALGSGRQSPLMKAVDQGHNKKAVPMSMWRAA